MKKILFVCTGNICRSPCAEAVLRHMAAAAGKEVVVDSAGTGIWRRGEAPDARASKAATARGYATDGLAARQVRREDFAAFDRIYAMTGEHQRYLQRLAPSDQREKILLFLPATPGRNADVPDPYSGGNDGFEHMMDLLEAGGREIVKLL